MKDAKKAADEIVRGGRSGRRVYGGIYHLKNGQAVYLAFRKRKEIFRQGEKSIHEAMQKGLACWAIDFETLYEMKIKGVDYAGVWTRDDHSIYISRMENWFDDTKVKSFDYASRGGSFQKYLNLKYFTCLRNPVKI